MVITDGRATAGPDAVEPLAAAMAAAEQVRRRGVAAVVVDAEVGHATTGPRLGLALALAGAMGARYLPITDFTAAALRSPA